MIKPEEIRVGNFFSHNKDSSNDEKGLFIWQESDWYAVGECLLFLENVDPVPITEERMLMLGFEKYNDCFFRIGKSEGWMLISDGNLSKSLSEFFVRVNYVHQLQDLFLALTGDNLIVKTDGILRANQV